MRAPRVTRPAPDQRHRRGPFDIIGDIHGCVDELDELLARLGYERRGTTWRSPSGRTPVFLGDLADRGPDSVGVFRRVMDLVARAAALGVPGNHDVQLQRLLEGARVPLTQGLDGTVAALDEESPAFRRDVRRFLEALPSHYLLDEGRLVVAHAGLPERAHGRESSRIRRLAAYGVEAGPIAVAGPLKRHAWVVGYEGAAAVVYGHTPVLESVWRGHTIDIDTGCVYGGRLTALQWPERTLVSVPARRAYAPPTRSFPPRPQPPTV